MTVSTSINGTLRDCTAQGKGIGRLSEGDIAFVDAPDMTRRFAELLVAAKPAAVVNVARFTTGLIPNYGPHVLLDAGIPLYEAAGSSVRGVVKDGKKASVSPTGEVMMGKKLIGQASAVSREDVDATFADAQQALVDNMEAYFGNTIQFIHSEAPLLIDGVGSPELGDTMAERKVLVVSQSEDLRERLDGLKFFIREYTPVIIGVGAAADTLTKLGYDMDFIAVSYTHLTLPTNREV